MIFVDLASEGPLDRSTRRESAEFISKISIRIELFMEQETENDVFGCLSYLFVLKFYPNLT